ncbi:ATP-binding protein [Rhodococcus aetherivorans]|uniref:ATP-binding protein n=1 Tax=Rhodococcus aetherivorans TaxID=191292 RepID=UPI00367183C7
MSDLTTWYSGNDRYLRLSLIWLRLRLERVAAEREPDPSTEPTASTAAVGPPLVTPPPPTAQRRHGFWSRAPRERQPGDSASDSGPTVAPRPPATPEDAPGPPRQWDEDIAAAAANISEAAVALSPPPALERIGYLLGLSDFERQVLLLCAAPELDTGMSDLFTAASGRPWPTFALALGLFDEPAWDVRSPERPLRFWHLLDLDPATAAPLNSTLLRADSRIVNAIKGLNHLDERLTHLFQLVSPPDGALPDSQQAVVAAAVDLLSRAAPERGSLVLQLVGPHSPDRTAVATRIGEALDRDLFRLRSALLPTSAEDLDLLARLWQRETVIAPLALYIEDGDGDPAATAARGAFLSRTGGPILLGGRDVFPDPPEPTVILDVASPTRAEQRALWQDVLGPDSDVDVGQLVEQFDLDGDAIRRIARDVGPLPDGAAATTVLRSAIRQRLRPRLEALAPRSEPVATWDSLVLPDAELALLHEIAAQVTQRSQVYGDWGFGARMNRGLGISALFAGESGTGKSMAAEVLANDLGLDLYRIDLSGVVSKYIGETEKNLRRLFDAAEGGGVILFFDEADALFGKRSEVKDAHDRYANIEINYLLQRMETYRGLAILTTNMRGALDRAFTRRLRFIVTFPFPSIADRARMWRIAFPPTVPLEPLDIARLARIDLTGAGIANAALNAAFRAAHAGRAVGMADVLGAARSELRKLDRPINEAVFRWESEVLA